MIDYFLISNFRSFYMLRNNVSKEKVLEIIINSRVLSRYTKVFRPVKSVNNIRQVEAGQPKSWNMSSHFME